MSRRARHRLVVDGRGTTVPLVVADRPWSRARGLLGVRRVEGAVLITPCSSVHSLGMLTDLEVAYLDADGVVLEVVALPRNRAHLPRRRARSVLEAAPGALSAWGLVPGTRVGRAPA